MIHYEISNNLVASDHILQTIVLHNSVITIVLHQVPRYFITIYYFKTHINLHLKLIL